MNCEISMKNLFERVSCASLRRVTAKSSSTKSFNKLTCPKELCNCIHLKLIFEIIYTSFGIMLVRYASVSYSIGWASSPQIHFWPLIVLTAKFGRDFQMFLLNCPVSFLGNGNTSSSAANDPATSTATGMVLVKFYFDFGLKFTWVWIIEKQKWEC